MSDGKEAFEKGEAKLPTGISSVDLAVAGGLPVGSFVVLFGETGSGREAFVHTSAFVNAAKTRGLLKKPDEDGIYLPENILYILLSKTKEDIIRDVNIGYSEDLAEAFREVVQFKDLMSDYYSSTFASLESSEEVSSEEGEEAIEIVKEMMDYVGKNGKNSLIFVDSLDDLIRAFPSGKEKNLLASLRAVRSENRKSWNSLIFSRLTDGIFPENVENSILSLVDGVFGFESRTSGGSRTRRIICDKFSGVTSEELLDSTFEFDVTDSGLEARRTSLLDT